MTTTTDYGTWANHNDGSTLTIEDTVAEILGDYASEYDIDAIVAEYRQAVDAMLPVGVTLHGNDFYGPYPVDMTAYNAIRGAIRAADFWAIAERHDHGARA